MTKISKFKMAYDLLEERYGNQTLIILSKVSTEIKSLYYDNMMSLNLRKNNKDLIELYLKSMIAEMDSLKVIETTLYNGSIVKQEVARV